MPYLNFLTALVCVVAWIKWTGEETLPYWVTVGLLGVSAANFLVGVWTL